MILSNFGNSSLRTTTPSQRCMSQFNLVIEECRNRHIHCVSFCRWNDRLLVKATDVQNEALLITKPKEKKENWEIKTREEANTCRQKKKRATRSYRFNDNVSSLPPYLYKHGSPSVAVSSLASFPCDPTSEFNCRQLPSSISYLHLKMAIPKLGPISLLMVIIFKLFCFILEIVRY